MEIIKGKLSKPQKIVIYGPEGIGKSTFASQFPNALFIDTEGSTYRLDVARMKKPSSWEYLNQQIEHVKKNKPCKTLVIDTIDWAERLAIDFIVARGGKRSITNFGYGEGFIQLEEEFGRFLNKLSDLIEVGINVVLTAHAKIVRFEQPDEIGPYDRWELKLGNKTTAKTSSLVKEWADMVLFANYKTYSVATDDKGTKFKGQGGKRVIYTSHHPAWDAKNRHGLPDELPFEFSAIAHILADVKSEPAPVKIEKEPVQASKETEKSKTDTDKVEKTNIKESKKIDINEVDDSITFGSPSPNIDSLPMALVDLMEPKKVTIQEIQRAVAKRGYYPEDTPVENYDPGFIQGVLVAAWEQVFKIIQLERDEIEEIHKAGLKNNPF